MSDRLKSWQPSASATWDRRRAGHLLRRAGFAPSASDIERALDEGLSGTIERLVSQTAESRHHDDLDALGSRLAARNTIDELRGWWCLRLRHTNRPLHARMAIFWHSHFATSQDKVANASLMLKQLRLFEEHALGEFEALTRGVSRDPAMIVFLDGNTNVKGRPNENYARELFELFTLGVGNYTEQDIKEAARAFTGWHERSGRFKFSRAEHDTGTKTVFEQTANFGGDDIVRLAIDHPACGTFLGRKLLGEFVTPNPDAELVSITADLLRAESFDMQAVLATLLGSRAMFEPQHYRARIKSPIEFLIGMARSLDLRAGGNIYGELASEMGQRLFEPPSVKGWDGHRTWINSASMLVRLNAVSQVTEPGGNARFDPGRIAAANEIDDADAARTFAQNLALDGDVPAVLETQLAATTGSVNEVLAASLRILMSSPEYQMA